MECPVGLSAIRSDTRATQIAGIATSSIGASFQKVPGRSSSFHDHDNCGASLAARSARSPTIAARSASAASPHQLGRSALRRSRRASARVTVPPSGPLGGPRSAGAIETPRKSHRGPWVQAGTVRVRGGGEGVSGGGGAIGRARMFAGRQRGGKTIASKDAPGRSREGLHNPLAVAFAARI